MERGYQGANMRSIAKKAQVTTGALYNYFANKAMLFDALVQEPAEEMFTEFKKIHRKTEEGVTASPDYDFEKEARIGTDWMLQYIYDHLDAFRLIFCRSEGTRWSTYLERLIEVEERAHRAYCNALGKDATQIGDVFLHVTATAGFQYLVEMVCHDLPYEQAVAVMESVKRYSMAGWHEVLGL